MKPRSQTPAVDCSSVGSVFVESCGLRTAAESGGSSSEPMSSANGVPCAAAADGVASGAAGIAVEGDAFDIAAVVTRQ